MATLYKYGFLAPMVALLFLMPWLAFPASRGFAAQQPTGSIPTVTGTPSGPLVTVNSDQDQINVRSGPGTGYPQVGVLVAGQQVPAIGRSPGGDWIQIVYPGVPEGVAWVYAFLVSAPTGTLPIVEPPPTATPRVTPTVDPTLAAQFIFDSEPTRLPTFTAPATLSIVTFTPDESQAGGIRLPVIVVILGLAVIGVFGGLISLLRR